VHRSGALLSSSSLGAAPRDLATSNDLFQLCDDQRALRTGSARRGVDFFEHLCLRSGHDSAPSGSKLLHRGATRAASRPGCDMGPFLKTGHGTTASRY
jgi:hypothetical protein